VWGTYACYLRARIYPMYLRHPRKSQRWSEKWKSYIDVTSEEDVQDGDKLTTVQAFVSAVDDAVEESLTVCKKVSKPSGSDTKVLSQLFPSVKKRSFSKVFDPAKECVAMPQQKKKAFRAKPSNVQVLMLDNPDDGIPRGKYRKEMAANERIKKLEFRRSMSSLDVKSIVLQNLKHLPAIVGFTLLEADHHGKLYRSKNQNPDGQYIIESSLSLYQGGERHGGRD
jgi:hypothetical protein